MRVAVDHRNREVAASGPRLRRALSLRDLIVYGVILVSPISPTPFFGILTQRGHGHAATTILIAMLAMLPTAISYGLMARVYPSAGSAFTYVSREISPALGYVTGWGMVMDYLLNPLISVIWVGQQANVFAPWIPYWLWAVFLASLAGVIVNTASLAAKIGAPFFAHYSASKFAVVGWTQALARELAAAGIRVNAVCPGFVRTAMQEREIAWEAELRGISSERVIADYIAQTPLGRLEEPEDVAGVVVFLCSDAARFMTGQGINVTGGVYTT